MSKQITIREDSVELVSGNRAWTVREGDRHYDRIRTAIKDAAVCEGVARDSYFKEAERLASAAGARAAAVESLAEEGIELYDDGSASFRGMDMAFDLGKWLEAAADLGQIEAVVEFIHALYANPSDDARKRLFGFLDDNDMPIIPGGRFIGYKVVTADFRDNHTGTVDNRPGIAQPPRLLPHECDTNSAEKCSKGYHICSKRYIPDYWRMISNANAKIISAAVSPTDVIAIPDDYNSSKLRCTYYSPLTDITQAYAADPSNPRLPTYGTSVLNPVYDPDAEGVNTIRRTW